MISLIQKKQSKGVMKMGEETKVNREYKDSVFTMYMKEPRRLVEVYNAIFDTDYPLDTPIEINTLEGALFQNRMNDISFILGGRLLVLIEHQSTINENMPVRMLLYLGRVYEKHLEKENIYRKRKIPLPAPEFVVLYIGEESYPEETYLRLSDSFLCPPEGKNTAEVTVRVLNIQYETGKEFLKKSRSLYEYSFFINRVREHLKEECSLKEAIHKAALDCEKLGVMQPFLRNHLSEVENMLFTEWNMEDALKIEREEGIEIGVERGMKKGMEKGMELGVEKTKRQTVQSLSEFFSVERIAEVLKMPVKDVNRFLES